MKDCLYTIAPNIKLRFDFVQDLDKQIIGAKLANEVPGPLLF